MVTIPDNVSIDQDGVGGTDFTAATDDIGGVHYQKVKLVDGTADSATAIPGDATNGLDVDVTRIRNIQTPLGDSMTDDTNDALRVNVVAGSTSGTEYTEGATDATITGGAILWEDAADTLRAVSEAKPLPVNVTAADGGTALTEPIVDAAGTSVPLKFASVAATADGDNTVISAVGGKKLRIMGYVLAATGSGLVTLKSGAGTTKGAIRVGADGGGASFAGGVDCPAFETATGEAFVINNAAGVDTYGHVTYVEL